MTRAARAGPATRASRRSRTSTPAPAAQSATHGATSFCASRSTPPPGVPRTRVLQRPKGSAALSQARTSPATAGTMTASRCSARAARTAAMKVSTASTAAVTATTVVERAAGCDAGFQNPPPLSSEPSTPSGVSDRAANSATPARDDRTPAVTAGSDHTADTPSAAAEASPRAPHRGRGARRTPPTASAPRTRVLAPPRPQAASPTAGHHMGALPCRTPSAATRRCGTAAYPRSTVH